jgi:hypothetical protein
MVMKNCARCGTENPDEAIFCAKCGNAFTPEEAAREAASPVPPPAGVGFQPGGAAPPPPPYGQPQAPQPGAPYGPGPYPVMAQVNNSKATASLVLGIVGLFVCPIVCSVLAIIFGSTAKNEIAASGGWQTGESNARAGIILGWIGLALAILGGIIWAIVVIVAASNVSMLPVIASAASFL